MKTLKLISIVITLSLASCRSREMSFGRSKTSETEKEKISLNESRSEIVHGVRVVETRDSSTQFVGLRIYPLDTFSLSVEDGFRGRAKVVEYWGVREGLTIINDSSAIRAKEELTREKVDEVTIKKMSGFKARKVKKMSIGMIGWVVILAVGVCFFWTWRTRDL